MFCISRNIFKKAKRWPILRGGNKHEIDAKRAGKADATYGRNFG